MSAAQFLIDTSALVPIMKQDPDAFAWQRAAAAGLIAVCPIVELEFFHSVRSAADREQTIEDMRVLFGWEPIDDRAFDRAWEVQGELTKRAQHRSAGPVDLVLAATAELRGLTLLHRDHDFDCIAAVTGQPHQWLGSQARADRA
ncbi:PIN domain nuclease [Nocardia sp. NBC_00565]|uniref:PIN domain nuclease n=1 Tax=Nocardia sp. NBC_00565 TaxID=2975993 RepID=UPI002E809438|nr:PIN domain nuclease [Nocardia sp. NBC_00565]WUC01500.1 PIN domain nuclease [Nocardia sp. NBC_00565]